MSHRPLPVRVAAAAAAALSAGALAWYLPDLGAALTAPRTGTFAVSDMPPASPSPVAVTDPDTVGTGPSPGPVPRVGVRSADLAALPSVDNGLVPTRVVVAGGEVDLPVVPAGVDEAGAMEVPAGSFTAAWYRFGPGAGASEGAAVVAAHVSSRADGRGPFSRLVALQPGARVDLFTDQGAVTYEVVSVEQVAKLSLDTASLFDRAGGHRLHLVTCGGRYDRSTNSYEDNVVVVARPVA